MKLIKDVIYNKKPNNITIYPTSVYIVKSCEEIQIPNEQNGTIQTKFQCDVEIYEVSEYISLLQKENTSLEEQITSLQIAMTEVYESTLV